MINNLLPSQCAPQLVFGLPLSADIRAMINDLSHPRPIPRLGLGLHPRRVTTRRIIRDSSRAPTLCLSQPGPHTRRLIAHGSICDFMSSMRLRHVVENSSADSSIDENDVPPLGQRRSSLHEDSSDDGDDAPPLRERHMVDPDSDSDSPLSLTYRQLARRHGWYESSSDSSDGSSVPSLEHDSDDSIENETRHLLPMTGGTPRNPRPIWFLEDEISYHETSSVSSSASSYTSSSSSDNSSHSGQGPFPFEFIDLLHLSVFNDQLRDHTLKSCLTWESAIAPSLPDDSNCPSVDTDSHRRPLQRSVSLRSKIRVSVSGIRIRYSRDRDTDTGYGYWFPVKNGYGYRIRIPNGYLNIYYIKISTFPVVSGIRIRFLVRIQAIWVRDTDTGYGY